MLICIQPVSYTHLDVYKRQSMSCERSAGLLREWKPLRAVSYTHLDVYKRQTEDKVTFVNRGKFIFTDNGSQSSCIAYFCIAGEELVCNVLMIFSGEAFSDAVLHQTGQRRKYVDRWINCLAMKLAVQNDLTFGDISGKVRNRMRNICLLYTSRCV